MKEGLFVLFPFPQTDQLSGKLRPALILRECPGVHKDWLVCMVSSQLRHELTGIDEIIQPDDGDFVQTGLKGPSVIRATRLAIVSASMLEGSIGSISEERLSRIRGNIARWITGSRTLSEQTDHGAKKDQAKDLQLATANHQAGSLPVTTESKENIEDRDGSTQ